MLLRLRPAHRDASSYAHPHEMNNGPAGIATPGDESVCCENSIDHKAVKLLAGQRQRTALFNSTHEAIYDLYYPEWKLPMRCRTL